MCLKLVFHIAKLTDFFVEFQQNLYTDFVKHFEEIFIRAKTKKDLRQKVL